MTAKQYLSQLRWLDGEIQTKQMELLELRARAEGCSAKELTGMPGGSGGSDRIGDTVSKIVDLENYIKRQVEKLYELQLLIAEQIDLLPDPLQRNILHRKYILRQNWQQIAEALCYSEPSCFRIHGNALREFADRYGFE